MPAPAPAIADRPARRSAKARRYDTVAPSAIRDGPLPVRLLFPPGESAMRFPEVVKRRRGPFAQRCDSFPESGDSFERSNGPCEKQNVKHGNDCLHVFGDPLAARNLRQKLFGLLPRAISVNTFRVESARTRRSYERVRCIEGTRATAFETRGRFCLSISGVFTPTIRLKRVSSLRGTADVRARPE